MSTVVKHWTYDDYAALPDDGRRHEVIDGELIVVPAPGFPHQSVLDRLSDVFGEYLKHHAIGRKLFAPFDVVLAPDVVVQPDLIFITNEHMSRMTRANLQGPPDLCVEVLSDSTRRTDETRKRVLYERFGVAEYWIVDPDAQWVKVLRGGEMTHLSGDDVLTSPLLPGFAVDVANLFTRAR